ncbi:tripartite tricarboxylate transporter permease [Mesorhizobium sp. CAU 1741]
MGLLTSSWQPWLVIIPGLLVGLVGAALPGISGSLTLALCLPFTPYMDFLTAMIFLTAVYTGGGYGGAISAILMNVPGSPSAVATTFDGYPMARAGLHNEALGIGLCSSAIGTLVGYILLIIFLMPLASMVLRLGPVEMLAVVLWGLTLIATLRGDSMAKGLVAGFAGLLIGTIGIGIRGDFRGTMGIDLLLDGVPVIPAMLGLLASAELFKLAGGGYLVSSEAARRPSMSRILKGMVSVFRHPGTLLRGSLIGVAIGGVPGVGSSVANLLSYADVRRRSADPESFGKGNPEGVIAAESANNSAEGGAMATLLALGLPGGGATAVLLAAFSMHNVTGGPRFINDNIDIVYAILISNVVQAFGLAIVGVFFIYLAGSIVRVPLRLLVPSVFVLSTFGTYAMTGTMIGPSVLVVFSLLGWIMVRYGYPVAPMVIGLLLAPPTEGNLLRSYQLSGGDVGFILERPIALVILGLLVLSLLWPVLRRRIATPHS